MAIERLSGDFIRGYTKAIRDISGVFEYFSDDLRHHKKRLNDKLAKELLRCVLENRANIREDIDGFFRWNCTTNKIEWFKRSDTRRNLKCAEKED